MNILKRADEIINQRSEEKEREYGPFSEGMQRAAQIASGMSGRQWTAHDMYIAMIALKFSRQSYNHKTDNLLDAVAYIGAWENFIQESQFPIKEPENSSEESSIAGAYFDTKGEKTLLTENELKKIMLEKFLKII